MMLLPLACGDDSGSGDAGGTVGSPTSTTMTPASDGTSQGQPATTTGGAGSSSVGPGDTTGDTTAATTDPGSSSGGVDSIPPTNSAELQAWLDAGEYLDWTAESGPHDSDGPHFGNVQTYVNNTMFNSLEQGDVQRPMGAAAVKELFGNGNQVRGWSVSVKMQADSAGGNGWYWYEVYDDQVYGDGVGISICTDCHGMGNDLFRSPFPLQ